MTWVAQPFTYYHFFTFEDHKLACMALSIHAEVNDDVMLTTLTKVNSFLHHFLACDSNTLVIKDKIDMNWVVLF